MLTQEDTLDQWNQIVVDYRQACLLRREGMAEEAGRLINEKLPKSIATWSREDRRSPQEKKNALRSMFSTEQSSIESWLLVHRTFASKLTDTLIPALRRQVGEEVRQALSGQAQTFSETGASDDSILGHGQRSEPIRFDDIPGVIDALLAEQQDDFVRRPAFAS
jgi:hypothetical protein